MNDRTNLAPSLNNPTNNPIKWINALIATAVPTAKAILPSNGSKNKAPANNASAKFFASELNNQILNPINAFTNDRNKKLMILPITSNGTTTNKKKPTNPNNSPSLSKFFKILFKISNPSKANAVNT